MTNEQNERTYTPPPVTGYRKLTQAEVDLMNEIKDLGDKLGGMVAVLRTINSLDQRCVSIGATEIQTGLMWLVRAVAQPTNF